MCVVFMLASAPPYASSELKEDDYEIITAEIDDLHWRALQWYELHRSGRGSVSSLGETEEKEAEGEAPTDADPLPPPADTEDT